MCWTYGRCPGLAGIANRGEDACNRRETSDYANVHTVFGRTSHRSWVHGSMGPWFYGQVRKMSSTRIETSLFVPGLPSFGEGPPFRIPLYGDLGTDTLNDLVGSRRETDKIGRTRDGGPDGPYRRGRGRRKKRWTTTGRTGRQSTLYHTSEGVSHSHFSLSRLRTSQLPPEVGHLGSAETLKRVPCHLRSH